MGLRAHWYPVATGALMSWIRQYCEERNEELKKLAISLGINIAAIFDPTGGLSLVGAVEASTRGDYLGCALNLARCHSDSLASSRRRAQYADRRPHGRPALRDQGAQRLVHASKNVLQRSRLAAEAGLAGIIKRVSAGAKLLRNEGWIRRLDPGRTGRRSASCRRRWTCCASLRSRATYIVIRLQSGAR